MRQRGAAVIVAMLIVALATIAAANFAFRAHVYWRKLENAANVDQARWLLLAAESWAAAVLFEDAAQGSVDHPGETWAREMPPVEAEGYELSGRILDQSGRFNINSLVRDGAVDATRLAVFRRLLRNLRLPVELADATADWLDADDVAGEGGAESDYYVRRMPAVRPNNRPIASLDELLPVRGMSREQLDRLRPFVSVLPGQDPVNVNTAAPELIAALSDAMTLDDAHAVAAKRAQAHFRNMGDLRVALGEIPAPEERLVAFSSRHFLVVVRVRRDRVALEGRALFERDGRRFPGLVWRVAG